MSYTLKETINTTDTARFDLSRYSTSGYRCTRWSPASSYTLGQLGLGLVIGAGTPPSSLLTARIYSDVTGGSPNPKPGTLLASSVNTIDQNTVTSSVAEYLFQFSGLSLASGTTYWFGLSSANYDSSNYVSVVRGPYNVARYVAVGNGTTWALDSNGYLWAKTYTLDASFRPAWAARRSQRIIGEGL